MALVPTGDAKKMEEMGYVPRHLSLKPEASFAEEEILSELHCLVFC